MAEKFLKISVLTPSFNSAKYIERAIQSVLEQDYPNVEHIVYDGGSKDGTVEILQRYPQVIWVSEKDKGQTDAMNKAYLRSTGELLVYLNADDFFLPGAFHAVNDAFQAHPGVDFVLGSLVERFEGVEEDIPMDTPASNYKQILQFFKYGFPANPVAYFYKRSLQERVGLFPLDEHYAMDLWFLLEATRSAQVLRIPHVLGVFYKTGLNKTMNSNNRENCFAVARKHARQHGIGTVLYFELTLLWYWTLVYVRKLKWPFKWLVYQWKFAGKIDWPTFRELGYHKSKQWVNEKTKSAN